MFKDKMIDVCITYTNHKHFEDRGYKIEYHFDKSNKKRVKKQIIQVNINDLPKNSHTLVEVYCENCNKVIKKEYRNAIKSKNFCDTKCKGEYMSKENLKEFENIIGENAYTYLYREYIENKKTLRQISKNVYGSEKNFSSIGSWCQKLDIQLRHGSEAIKTQWIDNEKRREEASERMKINSKNMDRSFMNKKEYRLKQSLSKMGDKNGMYGIIGNKHHNWTPNRTHEQRSLERKTYEVFMWRKNVFERDQYICQCCGYDKGHKIIAHHLYSYNKYEELRTETSNGVTLCEKCHKEFHGKYGYGNNTKEQFEEFIKARF